MPGLPVTQSHETWWLLGESMVWAAYEAQGVATAMLAGVLDELFSGRGVKPRLMAVADPGDIPRLEDLGLALWSLSRQAELSAAAAAIATVREQSPDTVCAVLLVSSLEQSLPLLVEAGAQIASCQLPSLECAVRHAARQFPISARCAHPLTSDLAQLLPWSDRDNS